MILTIHDKVWFYTKGKQKLDGIIRNIWDDGTIDIEPMESQNILSVPVKDIIEKIERCIK